jgi:predicted dehydrogenase
MKKVRYAVVGAGWIAQEAFMPAVAQTGNSGIAAIVTGNADAAARLAAFHGVPETCGYDGYDALLASGRVDAVYIALPNSMHADFAIRAARAGVHAMVEKPLAVTAAECQTMIDAAAAGSVYLMTAYRLHTEPGTIDVIERIRRGEIGDPRIFTSVFSFQSGPDNHRLKAGHWGGPLQDIGVYCLNAARHVFGAEPVEVTAMQTFGTDARFAEVAEMVTATLRFPGGRLATFTVSFNGADNDWYRVTGTKGEIVVDPGFRFETAVSATRRRGAETTQLTYPSVDHFGGQIAYLSDCIVTGTPPECDGAEGLADVLVMRAIEQAAITGASVRIDLPARPGHPDGSTLRSIPRTDHRLVL